MTRPPRTAAQIMLVLATCGPGVAMRADPGAQGPPRISVALLLLAEPSGISQTSDVLRLGPFIADPSELVPGENVYLEAWCQESGFDGITTAVVDVIYDPDVVGTLESRVFLDPQWSTLPFDLDVRDDQGLVDNLGGNNLSSGTGASPHWAKLGTIEFTVRVTPTAPLLICTEFAGEEPKSGFAQTFTIFGVGAVDPTDVDYGCSVVGCKDADCGDVLFCNGSERCVGQVCDSPGNPCVAQWCDEGGKTCREFGNGDVDENGRIDLRDVAAFMTCFGRFALPDCTAMNLADDGIVTLEDHKSLAERLTGPATD